MEEIEKKEIEVISGDGSNLDISPVRDHLNAIRPKSKDEKDSQNIVIPEVKEPEKESESDNNGN